MVIKWNKSATKDLNDIHKYISRDSEVNATNQILKIGKRIGRIGDFPTSGHFVRERKNKNTREIKEGRYRIIYRVYINHIRILYIRHSKRLFK